MPLEKRGKERLLLLRRSMSYLALVTDRLLWTYLLGGTLGINTCGRNLSDEQVTPFLQVSSHRGMGRWRVDWESMSLRSFFTGVGKQCLQLSELHFLKK